MRAGVHFLLVLVADAFAYLTPPAPTAFPSISRVALYGWDFAQDQMFRRAAPFITPRCVTSENEYREPASEHGVVCDYPGASYVPYGCNPLFRIVRLVIAHGCCP